MDSTHLNSRLCLYLGMLAVGAGTSAHQHPPVYQLSSACTRSVLILLAASWRAVLQHLWADWHAAMHQEKTTPQSGIEVGTGSKGWTRDGVAYAVGDFVYVTPNTFPVTKEASKVDTNAVPDYAAKGGHVKVRFRRWQHANTPNSRLITPDRAASDFANRLQNHLAGPDTINRPLVAPAHTMPRFRCFVLRVECCPDCRH